MSSHIFFCSLESLTDPAWLHLVPTYIYGCLGSLQKMPEKRRPHGYAGHMDI